MLKPDSLAAALVGVDTAYYLVHSLASGAGFEAEELRAARHFATAAEQAGLRRIIYLGGLGEAQDLSPHLRSRQEVGRLLRASGVPTLEFRASIIIGSGSLSFEMIRALVRKLPVMITPRWTRSLAQPIAIEDVIAYLVAALDVDAPGSAVYEIGGPDVVSYADLMREFARQRRLRRLIIPVGVLSPRLSSWWLGLVTPVYARIGRKLIESVRHDTIVTSPAAAQAFDIQPRGLKESVARALANEDQQFAQTRWSDALISGGRAPRFARVTFGTRLLDTRVLPAAVPAEVAFATVERIGGQTGWYFGDWLWQLRGWMDLAVGGVGLRRGRRHPAHLRVGDTVDFWRVEQCTRPHVLRLAAEMRVPGRAWLQFEVEPIGDTCAIRQTAVFDPGGLAGLLYWYALYPLHAVIFNGMLRGVTQTAAHDYRRQRRAAAPSSPDHVLPAVRAPLGRVEPAQ